MGFFMFVRMRSASASTSLLMSVATGVPVRRHSCMITSIVELLNVSFMAFSPVCQTCGFAPAIVGGDQDSAALMACI